MGGSQVFLDEGEVQTVETLIKCIAVDQGATRASARICAYTDPRIKEEYRQAISPLLFRIVIRAYYLPINRWQKSTRDAV